MSSKRWLTGVSIAALLISVCAFTARAARAPEAPVRSATTLGVVGVAERVSDIMKRQMVADESGVRTERDAEEKEDAHEHVNRANLPANPDSPEAPTSALSLNGGLSYGGNTILSPQTVGVSFTGATLSGTNPTSSFPPDCMGAVGPTQYVVFVNGRLVTFNKTTGVADGVLNADPDVFFTSVRNSSITSDPRIRYDRLTGRWFLIIINTSTPNRILFAVSSAGSSTITASTTFTYFYIPINTTPPTIASTCFADYPTLGLDANALYIGTNDFCGSGGSYNGTDGYVVRKSSIMGTGPLVVTAFRALCTASGAGPYTPQGVDNYDASATEGYFIGTDNASTGLLQMRRVSTPGATPTISANIPITVAATSASIPVPHKGNTGGTTGYLDALDDRLYAAHIRNGQLWTAHNIALTNAGAASGTLTRNGIRWYHLNVPSGSGTPTVTEYGTVYTSNTSNLTTDRHYWIPSIMVSGQGHAALGFSAAGSNEYANCGTVGRLSTDTQGTMGTPVLITNSTTAYNPSGDPGTAGYGRRWGDYSYVSLDPVDDMTMWTVHMFCDATNSYGVRATKLIAPPPATPATLADITAGTASVTLTLTGTQAAGSGFYDPGTNLPSGVAFNHLAAACTAGGATGTPPTVTSVTYLTPTTMSVTFNASAATANSGSQKYTLTVTNPDGQTAAAAVVHVVAGVPTVNLGTGPTANEGNSGTTTFAFPVNLSAASASPVVVRWHTSDGTATTADNDYTGVAGDSITIAAGSTSGTINVSVKGDTKYETNETFSVVITGATNATLGATTSATGTITNDDSAPTIAIVSSASTAEGNSGTTSLTFGVTLSNASYQNVSANYSTSDNTATVADGDYVAGSGTITIPAGSTSGSIGVTVNGDTKYENNESFSVTLVSPVNGALGNAIATGTITNDDAMPTLSINNVSHNEGNSGTTTYHFTVTLSQASGLLTSVDYTTVDGTATTADGDYTAASGTLVIPAGQSSGGIDVPVNGDTNYESDEAFTVVLANPVSATIAAGTGTGTIVNDDSVPVDVTAPVVTVTAPNGGESWDLATSHDITWTATDSVGVTTVDVLLSRDGGSTWADSLALGIANTGTWSWTVTSPATANALVKVFAHDAAGNVGSDLGDAVFTIHDPIAGVSGGPVTAFALGAVLPNPSHGAVQIAYDLPREANVRVAVLDVQGREVALLASGVAGAGRHTVTWNATMPGGATARGLYFVRYTAGGKVFSKRFAVIQ